MTREEAIKVIRKMLACTDLSVRANLTADMVDACHLAIEALEQEPILDKYQTEIDHLHKYIARLETQITDSFINKSYVSEKVCEHDKNVVIDKIRAEIEKEADASNRLQGISEIGLRKALKILDKYKAEVRDK